MKSDSNRTRSSPAKGQKPKILIAEDECVVMRCIEALLRAAGYQNLAFASDGENALSQILEDPPQLVVLDVMMPKLDGRRVLQALKEKEATAGIPILVVTSLRGSSLDFYLDRADAVIQKPFDQQELLGHVSRLLSLHKPAG